MLLHSIKRLLRTGWRLALAVALMTPGMIAPASAISRIKDIADFEGVRENQLVGYGIVVGLNGTGDDLEFGDFHP